MGTAGHMQHPFDIKSVKTGQDLINYFNNIVKHLTKNPGSVKFDGINVSFKLVDDPSTPTGKDFRMDRGTSEPSSVKGMTAADAYNKWPEGHGMPPAIDELLTIFNQAIKDIEPELKALKIWDDPTKYFNTEYMKKGKTNVIDYPEKLFAINGVNQFYEKTAQPHRIKKGIGMNRPGLKRPIDPKTNKPTKFNSIEIDYDKEAIQSIIKKVAPIAKKYDVSLVGDVPTELDENVLDFDEILKEPFTIHRSESDIETKPLEEWLKGAKNPFDLKVTKKDGRKINAISKEVYFDVLSGKPLANLYETYDDIYRAIDGALFNHATNKLGVEIKRASKSEKGDLSNHEGIVIRGLESKPVKVTGDFIIKGASGIIKSKLNENINMDTVTILPGKFKPPHRGHLDMINHYSKCSDKVVVLVSPKKKNAITAEMSKKILEMYIKDAKIDNVLVELSEFPSPVRAAMEYGNKADMHGKKIILGASTKGGDAAERFSRNIQKYVESAEILNPMDYAFEPIGEILNATDFRRAIETNNDIIGFLPEYSLNRKDEILQILRENKEDTDPFLGIFRGLVEEVLEEEGIKELSSMGSGAVAGYALPLGAKPKRLKVKKRKKRKKNKIVTENEVNEAFNYLLQKLGVQFND